jgi:hypothetical protein
LPEGRVSYIDEWTALLADLDPYQRSRVLKQIDARNPPSFFRFAKGCFAKESARQAGAEALLLETGLLVRAVCNPGILSVSEAVELAREAIEYDPTFDAKILRYLSAPPRIWPEEVTEEEALHVLSILDRFSDGRRLVAALVKFLALPFRKARSKATKLMARGTRSAGWVEVRRQETDPRVRANLIDGLRLQERPLPADILSALEQYSTDPNHRVAATCLLLLAELGNSSAEARLQAMLNHPSLHFRKAAAWALKELGGAGGGLI